MPAGGPAYLELNFAPSSQWASYRFDGERTGMALAIVEPRGMHCLVPPGRLELTVDVDLGHLAPTDEDAGEWRLGLSAVIEDIDHVVSYWALTHPSDKPDFHHPDSFTLVLPATEPA